jgi:hypothetical protein
VAVRPSCPGHGSCFRRGSALHLVSNVLNVAEGFRWIGIVLQGSGSRYRPRPPRHTRTRTWLMVYEYVAVKPRVSLARGAAEADLVAVGVAVDDLAHTIAVRLLRRGLDSSGADGLHPLIQVVDEQRV